MDKWSEKATPFLYGAPFVCFDHGIEEIAEGSWLRLNRQFPLSARVTSNRSPIMSRSCSEFLKVISRYSRCSPLSSPASPSSRIVVN